ncbi:unnamed protein product [Colias eurytheme]|nr:unnamed protein product [Colias eurytheme]
MRVNLALNAAHLSCIWGIAEGLYCEVAVQRRRRAFCDIDRCFRTKIGAQLRVPSEAPTSRAESLRPGTQGRRGPSLEGASSRTLSLRNPHAQDGAQTM